MSNKKLLSKITICVFGIMFAMLLFNNKGVYAAAAKNVTVKFNKTSFSLYKGKAYTISYSFNKTYTGNVSWKITDGSIATAKADYKNRKLTIYGHKHGTTYIRLWINNGYTTVCTINVIDPTTVSFSRSSMIVTRDSSSLLNYSTSLSYSGVVSWKIANGNIATAKADYSNKKLTIYGHKVGTTSIKLWLENGKYTTCNIEVINNFTVHTGKSSSNLVLTKSQLQKAINNLSWGSKAKSNLRSSLDAFVSIQNKYKVNAVFAMAVTKIESGCGTGWAAIPSSTYNWYSLTGSYNGQYVYTNRQWKKYTSFSQATMDFGNVIANSAYYFRNGKYTVKSIATVYCDAEWGTYVNKYMREIYRAAGVNV